MIKIGVLKGFLCRLSLGEKQEKAVFERKRVFFQQRKTGKGCIYGIIANGKKQKGEISFAEQK